MLPEGPALLGDEEGGEPSAAETCLVVGLGITDRDDTPAAPRVSSRRLPGGAFLSIPVPTMLRLVPFSPLAVEPASAEGAGAG
jgi:hypothetical protein